MRQIVTLGVLLISFAVASGQETSAPDSGGATASDKTDDKEIKTGYAGYTDSEGRGEKYWLATVQAARGKILALRKEVSRLDLLEAAIQNEFYSIDDPYQREQTKKNWNVILDRRATMRYELELAEGELGRLEREAHRTGALPGWLRETRDEAEAREQFENRAAQDSATYAVDMEQVEKDNKAADEKIFGKEETSGKKGGQQSDGS